jgi:hypothetical protein
MKIFLLFSILFLKTFTTEAQISADTVRALIGEKASLAIVISAENPVKVSGEFLLSNSTVFYPEEFLKADSVVLKKVNDSVYTFSFTARDTVFLKGEMLAGADSVCEISFKNITIDNSPAENFGGKIITQYPGDVVQYIRFATLETGFPNPAYRGQKITWAYRLDKPSNVKFGFYTILGKEILLMDLGEQNGIKTFELTPDVNFAAGVYWVRLITNSGESLQQMMVVP